MEEPPFLSTPERYWYLWPLVLVLLPVRDHILDAGCCHLTGNWSKHRWRACPSILSGVSYDQPYLFTHVFHQCWGWICVSDSWLVFEVDSAAREMKLCAFSSIVMADSYAIKLFLLGALYAYRGASWRGCTFTHHSDSTRRKTRHHNGVGLVQIKNKKKRRGTCYPGLYAIFEATQMKTLTIDKVLGSL